MSKHGQPMSQTLAEMQMNELKMNDPKLNKIFDKLKKGDKIKLKTSSTMSKGSDFVEYIVKSKNVVNKGRVEKITLATVGNEEAVKKFLYRRDGKVTFAMGDMAASIDDIKEKYSLINHEIVEEVEVEELDEMNMTHVLINMQGKVQGYTSNEKDAKEMARRTKSTIHPIKKKISDKTLDKMNALAKTPKELQDLGIIDERAIDPADVDDDATDADKKAADKNIIMQMRKAMDVKGNMKIEFGDGKKEKVDPKILQMMVTAHGKIQKPRDKEKFVAMISKSKRDMLNVAKMVGKQLRMGEEIELDEGAMKDLLIKGQDLEAYAKKHGGIDKKDMMKVAAMLKKGDKSGALKYAKGMDTDPRDYILDLMGENLDEKVEYVEYKFKNERDAKAAKAYFDGIQLMSFDVNDDNIRGGELMVDAGSKDMTKYHKEVMKKFKPKVMTQESLEEKYDLYHKTFSDAMQHAYDYAKKKLGITVDPKEIDNKVATGPKKPSEGKTNKYRLKGKGGNLQIQVYNKGGSKPFELNMYKEENDMTKSLKDTVLEMWTEASEGFASDAQRKAAFASGYKEKGKKKKDEGNAFGAALQAAKENGEDTFVVAGKTYKVKDEEKKLDKVNPKAVKKDFDDRKDKDIDNDGDVDSTDKYLHKRRKAISKAINNQKESIERYHETKQGSLRESILKMWGEINEKVEYVEYKFKNEKDAKAAKAYFDGIQLMSFDVNDDNIRGGELMVDAGSKDMTKYHKEVMKKFRPKVMTQEKKDLTNEKKDDTKKMTDTGKEVTPVELSVKMPKIKETKNKV